MLSPRISPAAGPRRRSATVARPVLAAVAAIVHVLPIVAAVILGVAAVGLVALLVWRWRRTLAGAARTVPPQSPVPVRAAPPLPQARRAAQLPAAPGVNHLAVLIFTSTAWTPRKPPPSPPAGRKAADVNPAGW